MRCDRLAGVSDGTRTHDNRGHNPGLYHLSYTHHTGRHAASGLRASLHSEQRVARLRGFEPLTHGLEGRCSVP